ncbi:MAG: CRISPR-associated endoribonuclease Cse3 [Dehalococcoidia bacterium]|nr:CRISPR-associated endoribonuclease Cse3 [Bacillota bacterium]
MYLSKLILNPRLREARKLMASPYGLHKAVARAFPDATDGGPGRVLYRLDEDNRNGILSLLVQSEKEPGWSRAELLINCLNQPAEYKAFAPAFRQGQALYFRLRANPTVKRDGKRLGLLREEEQSAWLRRKGENGGFSVLSYTVIPEGMLRDNKRESGVTILSLLSVRFEGVLRVEQPDAFLATIEKGVGSGKGLGFGLLSVAPIREL